MTEEVQEVEAIEVDPNIVNCSQPSFKGEDNVTIDITQVDHFIRSTSKHCPNYIRFVDKKREETMWYYDKVEDRDEQSETISKLFATVK